MSGAVRDLALMLAGLDPHLDPQRYQFVTAPGPRAQALATFHEDEGWSSIVVADDAAAAPMKRITLQVHSALEGVGLTAAVTTCLAQAGIACNMVAAFHHDHLFVPEVDANRALALLKSLQATNA